jgi:hypothetical protein
MIRVLAALLFSIGAANAQVGSLAPYTAHVVTTYEVASAVPDGFGSSTITLVSSVLTVPNSYLFTFVGGDFDGQFACGTANSTTELVAGGFDPGGSCTLPSCGSVTLGPC